MDKEIEEISNRLTALEFEVKKINKMLNQMIYTTTSLKRLCKCEKEVYKNRGKNK